MPGGNGWEVEGYPKDGIYKVAFRYGDDRIRYFTSTKSWKDAWKKEKEFSDRYDKRLQKCAGGEEA